MPPSPSRFSPSGLSRRTLVAGAGWIAAAGVATLIGVAGIRLIGEGMTGTPGGVLDQEQVSQALALASTAPAPTTPTAPEPSPSVSPSPSASASASPSVTATRPASTQRVVSSPGGNAIATCTPGGLASLVTVSPSPGFRVKDRDREPDDEVEVKFEGAGRTVELKIHCVGGVPAGSYETDSHSDDDDD